MARTPGPLFAFCLATIALISPLAIHIYLPLIPAVKQSLDLTDAMAQLLFSIAMFGMSFATLFWGAMSDRLGRRPILLTGLVLFLVGSAACAIAQSVETLLAGRLLQAVGAGAGAALVRTIARDAYGADRLVKAIAYLTMFYTLGPMISPIVGGLLVDTLGWRSVFGFAMAAGGLIAIGAYFVIWETLPPAARALVPKSNPLRDFGVLFSNLRFTCFVLQTGFNTGAFFVAASASAILMKETLHRPSAEFGFWFLLFPVGFFAGNFVSSRVGASARNEVMVLTGSVVALIAVLVQSGFYLWGVLSPLTIFLPGFVITFAQGISLPYGQAGAISAVPRIAGTAAGVGIAVQNLVGASFAQFFGLLANGTVVPVVVATCLSAFCGFLVAIPPMAARWRG